MRGLPRVLFVVVHSVLRFFGLSCACCVRNG